MKTVEERRVAYTIINIEGNLRVSTVQLDPECFPNTYETMIFHTIGPEDFTFWPQKEGFSDDLHFRANSLEDAENNHEVAVRVCKVFNAFMNEIEQTRYEMKEEYD